MYIVYCLLVVCLRLVYEPRWKPTHQSLVHYHYLVLLLMVLLLPTDDLLQHKHFNLYSYIYYYYYYLYYLYYFYCNCTEGCLVLDLRLVCFATISNVTLRLEWPCVMRLIPLITTIESFLFDCHFLSVFINTNEESVNVSFAATSHFLCFTWHYLAFVTTTTTIFPGLIFIVQLV